MTLKINRSPTPAEALAGDTSIGVVAVVDTVTCIDLVAPVESISTTVAAPPLTPLSLNSVSVTAKVVTTLTSLLITLKGPLPPPMPYEGSAPLAIVMLLGAVVNKGGDPGAGFAVKDTV